MRTPARVLNRLAIILAGYLALTMGACACMCVCVCLCVCVCVNQKTNGTIVCVCVCATRCLPSWVRARGSSASCCAGCGSWRRGWRRAASSSTCSRWGWGAKMVVGVAGGEEGGRAGAGDWGRGSELGRRGSGGWGVGAGGRKAGEAWRRARGGEWRPPTERQAAAGRTRALVPPAIVLATPPYLATPSLIN